MTYLHRLFGPLYRSADAVAKAILGSRLHFLLSGHFIVIEFTGLRTGVPYRVGLTYRQHGNTLHSMTHRRRLWWRNLRGGRTLAVIYKGKRVPATSDVEERDPDVIAAGLKERDILRRTFYNVPPEESVLIRIMLGTVPQQSPPSSGKIDPALNESPSHIRTRSG